MTQRFKLIIEYEGTQFCGWQTQRGGGAVQDALSEAVFKFCGEEVNVNGAGRTDTGVHARGQVAHLDIEKSTDASTLLKALNFHLKPHPVAVLSAQLVDNEFDARFSALRRHYEYRILSRRVRPTLMVERVWWVPVELDVAAMQEASVRLTGRHDFTTFRSAHCQAASPERSLDRLDVVAVDYGSHSKTGLRLLFGLEGREINTIRDGLVHDLEARGRLARRASKIGVKPVLIACGAAQAPMRLQSEERRIF